MNVLSDFEIRVNAAQKLHVDNDVARLSKIIREKEEQIAKMEQRLQKTTAPKPKAKGIAVKKSTTTKKKS